MTTITLEEARLIIKRWAESSALLLIGTSEQPRRNRTFLSRRNKPRWRPIKVCAWGYEFSLEPISLMRQTCRTLSLGVLRKENTRMEFLHYRTPRN